LLEGSATMASHASFRRWLLRDMRKAYVLLVLVAFVVAIFTYFIDWPTFRHEAAVQPKKENIEQRYTGSIIVPAGGGQCWTFILDNRTGFMRDGGYFKCDEATRQFDEKISPEATRLREVGKAFRNKSD
jgi:hypothetical protein